MTVELSDEELSEIEARCNAASTAPWIVEALEGLANAVEDTATEAAAKSLLGVSEWEAFMSSKEHLAFKAARAALRAYKEGVKK